jgi:hypothetical protein
MYRSGFTIVPERPDAAYDDLLATFEQRLRTADARNMVNDGKELRFTGGIFRLSALGSWNLLAVIGKGGISIDRQANRVTYWLSFAQLVIVGILMIGLLDTCMALGGKIPLPGICAVSPFFFLWAVGMNYLIALARFDRFMKRCIREAGFAIQARKKEVVSS